MPMTIATLPPAQLTVAKVDLDLGAPALRIH